MAEASRYLLATTKEESDSIIDNVAIQIQEGHMKLLDLVVSVGPYVTAEDLTEQAKAIEYMSAVLAQIQPNTLVGHDISLIVRYFVSRLETPDAGGFVEAARGLRSLQAMSRYTPYDSVLIIKALFSIDEAFKKHNATTRLEFYKLIDDLVVNHRASLQSMKNTFVEGFVSLTARERDPRNLMIYLSTMRIVIIDFEYDDEQNTALWDAISRYFPIHFGHRPTDPFNITEGDLKLRLRSCIGASSRFAPLAFPFLIQKLDAQTTANVKKDVMQTMAICVMEYDPETLSAWSFQLWEALKYEVLNATEDDLAVEALNVLHAVALRLAFGMRAADLQDSPLYLYVSLVTTGCNGYLKEPQAKFAKQSGQILSKIAASSPFAFHITVNQVLPTIMTIYNGADALAKRRDLLDIINGLLDARLEFQKNLLPQKLIGVDGFGQGEPDEVVTSGGLQHFGDSLFEMFTVALTTTVSQEVSLRLAALKGTLSLVTIRQFLQPSEVGMVIQKLNDLILDRVHAGDQVHDAAINAMQQIAWVHHQMVTEITLPLLMAQLPDTLKKPSDESYLPEKDDPTSYLLTLEALSKIAAGGILFETLVRRLLNKFQVALFLNADMKYANVILTGLLFGIKQHNEAIANRKVSEKETSADSSSFSREGTLYTHLVGELFQKVMFLFKPSDVQHPEDGGWAIGLRQLRSSDDLVADDDCIALLGNIVMNMIRSLTRGDQEWFIPRLCNLCLEIPEGMIGVADSPQSNDSEYKTVFPKGFPLIGLCSANEEENGKGAVDALRTFPQTEVLLMYTLAGLCRELPLPFNARKTAWAITRYLPQVPEQNMSESTRSGITDLLAILVNKWDAAAPNAHATEMTPQYEIKLQLDTIMQKKTPEASAELEKVLPVAFAITKAANLRGAHSAGPVLKTLLAGLESPLFGRQFATRFNQLLAPSPILSSQNSAVIRVLHKQRMFNICVPEILKTYKENTEASIKSFCLIALAGIVRHTPPTIVLPRLDELLPLLLLSLDFSDAGKSDAAKRAEADNVKEATLDVLYIAIKDVPTALEGHTKSIIDKLTVNFYSSRERPSHHGSMVRAKALKCLAAIPRHFRDLTVLPYRLSVIRSLQEGASGDKKRSVRVESVDCRGAWANLAEPSAED